MKCNVCGSENLRKMVIHNSKIGAVEVEGGEIPVVVKEAFVCLSCGHIEIRADLEDLLERLKRHHAI